MRLYHSPVQTSVFHSAAAKILRRDHGNFKFHWTKTLHQNNLNNIAFFFTLFKG